MLLSASAPLLWLALAAGPRLFAIPPGGAKLSYDVVHKLHEVKADSTAAEGKAAVSPDGTVQAMVRVPVSSFMSGDGNRDEHMLETLEASRFPTVTLKLVGKVKPPETFPATVTATFKGELELHGQKNAETVEVTIAFASAGEARVTTRLTVSLDRYKIERPSLLFVKLDDPCKVEVDALFKEDLK
jgi:polyisoprenoid-binding protein YceI